MSMLRLGIWARIAAISLLATSCGYIMAGSWEDDPKNWGRYFGSAKPDDVVIVHSKYWRSPHWTYEFGCYFEIDPTPELTKQLFTQNRLRRLSEAEVETDELILRGTAPTWFPKDLSGHEAWKYEAEPESCFRVYVDSETGHLFMTDRQI